MRPSRRLITLVCALVPLLGLPALPAFASSTSNDVVYATDPGAQDGFYNVALFNPDANTTRTVLQADAANGVSYDHPELSPDGSQIVATQYTLSSSGPQSGAIVVVNRDGTGLRTITTPSSTVGNEVSDSVPVWSPDGSTILFSRSTATTPATGGATTFSYALETVPAAGGATTPVPGGTGGYSADYDPTGTKIVFAVVQSGQDSGPLMVMNTDGTNEVALGTDVTGALPAWSPDGATIAYATVTDRDTSSAGADVAQIATVPASGGTPTVMAVTRPSSARTVAEYPAWSVDGESILFDLYAYDSAGNQLPGDLWSMDRAGTRAGKFLGGSGDEAQPFEQGPVPASVVSGAPSRFRAVTPVRILDTRAGVGAPAAKVQPKTPLVLTVRGAMTDAGPVPDDATAVILNVTVVDGGSATDIRVYPSDSGVPGSSNLNAATGTTVPNLVTATLSASGQVSLYSSGGPVDLIADLAGWYTPTTGDSGFTPLDPRRILDTRSPAVGVPAAGPVQSASPIDLQVTGSLPTSDGDTVTVPSDATAVVLNVTALNTTRSTDVRVYPTPSDPSTPEPLVSNLNLHRGQVTPNLVTVAVGNGGRVRLATAAGQVDLLADIAGYYSASSAGRYVPVVPLRLLDTRTGVGSAATPVQAGQFVDLKIAGGRGVPATALAAVVNVTATGVTSPTDVRAYPKPAGSASPPTVSNLNLVSGLTRANLAVVKPGDDGRVRIRNEAGSLHLIGDIAGYFI